MSDLRINDDFSALADLIESTEDAPDGASLEQAQAALLERIRAELIARSDGLRRAIIWYEKLADDAKRVAKQAAARAALVREYVKNEMQAAGTRKVQTASGSLMIRGNGGLEPLVITDAALLPDEYCTVQVRINAALWAEIRRHVAECGRPGLAAMELSLTSEREPSNALIRAELAKPCGHCKGTGTRDLRGTVMALSADDKDLVKQCPDCGGTGHRSVPGCRLDPRGESLVVK